jgi:diguanylate cyclase (GGDEF)-like protein
VAKFLLLALGLSALSAALLALAGPGGGPLPLSWPIVVVAAWLSLHRVRLPAHLSGDPMALNLTSALFLIVARFGGAPLALAVGAVASVWYVGTRLMAPRVTRPWQAMLVGYPDVAQAQKASQTFFVYAENASSTFFTAAAAVWVWRLVASLGLAKGPAPLAWGGWILAACVMELVQVLRILPWLALLGRASLLQRRATWTAMVLPSAVLDALFGVLTQALATTWGMWGFAAAGVLALGGVSWSGAQARAVAAAAALQAAEMAARTDPLTGLPNRLAMEEYARSVLRAGLGMVLAMADADHFKRVNDTWGHHAGDEVLTAIAQRLAGACRTHRSQWPDRVGRWGGEEFLLLLPGMDRVAAARRLESIREAVSRTPVYFGSHAIRVTVSVGATLLEGNADGFEKALARADQALYRAKAEGRDRLVWNPPLQPEE